MSATLEKKPVGPIGSMKREGILRFPPNAIGIVVFAHGAGSSRLSPRNNYVAERFAQWGLATLLFDLLTETESLDRANVFDIPLLSARVVEAIQWLDEQPDLCELKIGLFGASTGAASALVAAAREPEAVVAVVSRGGRPDLAGDALPDVQAPTLLVVGGEDGVVIDLNKKAAQLLNCDRRMEIIPGATHLFEEPGTLDLVVELAADWFEKNMTKSGQSRTDLQ